MTNTSRPLDFSRRHVLAGLAATPALTAAVPAAAQTGGLRWTPQQAQVAQKGWTHSTPDTVILRYPVASNSTRLVDAAPPSQVPTRVLQRNSNPEREP